VQISLLLEMAAQAMPDRVGIVTSQTSLTFGELAAAAHRAGSYFDNFAVERVVLVDGNSEVVPIALFGAAIAGKVFVPVNFRLTDHQLRSIVERTAPAIVIVGPGIAERLAGVQSVTVVERSAFLRDCNAGEPMDAEVTDPDTVAVHLYTSGTTGEPKAAVLRHSNLTSYILSTVEFAATDDDEAALVSVPPYHIAGVSAVLSSCYGGRRIVYLESFDPTQWVDAVDREHVTHAMVVPTMLGRVLDRLEQVSTSLKSLRTLSYGGGPMPLPVIERAMRLLPHVGFVNAYGLTETSSTVAVLGPDEHRTAITSEDPVVRRRLSSVGRPLPTVELTIRDPDGNLLDAEERGEIWVRGPQVAGEYVGVDGREGGWFNTRDSGELDRDGYLYVHGRLDDVIVRGGENLSPEEIETVLTAHPAVEQAAVVGIPDVEWGERVVAAVVRVTGQDVSEEGLRDFVRERLRSTRTPERIEFRDELPVNETGKLLRRVLRDELTTTFNQS
jgi:fatty-acyl-CoA synthase